MKAIAELWGWQPLLKLGLVLSRGVLGLFVAAVLGFGLYVMTLAMYVSIWGYGTGVVAVLVVSTGIGAAVGSYLTWFDRDHNISSHAIFFAVVLVCSMVGSWVGLQRGIDVGAIHPIWRPGIPETSVTVMGAVISANVPMFVLGLYKAAKHPRL
ncbi:MAG: hypothetical protein OXD31_06440 [Chloroflexi bacterium]|nr:hypothetical protein [Chloroflexota bacterium]